MADVPEPETPPTTYRWRRRAVMPVRVTWLGMVLVLLLLVFFKVIEKVPTGQGGRVLAFILVVILPMIAVGLWRAGLLPPERVEAEFPPER